MLSRRDFVRTCLSGISLLWWRPALVDDPVAAAREWFNLIVDPKWDRLADKVDPDELRRSQTTLCRAARVAASCGMWEEFNRHLQVDSPQPLARLSHNDFLRLLRQATDRQFPNWADFLANAGFETLGSVRQGRLAYVLYQYNAATMSSMWATKPFLLRLRQSRRGWVLLFDQPPTDFRPFHLPDIQVAGVIPAGVKACFIIVNFKWHSLSAGQAGWTKPFIWYCDSTSPCWPHRDERSELLKLLREQAADWLSVDKINTGM